MSLNLSLERTVNAGIVATNPDNLRAYMEALKLDVIEAAIASAVAIHHVSTDLSEAVPAAPSNTAECITFVNTMKTIMNGHFAGAHPNGNHVNASAEVIVHADASDLATALTMATELVTDYNTHRTEANVHITNDVANIAVDAGGAFEADCITTCTSIRTEFLAHMANGLAMNAGTVE